MPVGARARRAALAAAAAAATFLVFAPSLSHAWLNWDDDILVLGNPALRNFGPALARWAFTRAPAGAYQPLAFLVWGAVGAGAGFGPFAFHLANVLPHALAAALAFFAARRLLGLSARPGARDEALDAGALAAALVFAVHPLRVESVSWIAELRDPLSGVLWLAALLAYLRAREPGRLSRGLWSATALFAAACLAKGTAVTFPLVLLVVDVWPLRRRLRDAWREKIPLFALSAALGATQLWTQRGARASATWADHGLAARLAQTAYALAFYARKTLWPSGLSPIYELRPPLNPLEPRFLYSAAVVAAFAAWAWRGRRERPWWAAAGAAYLAMLFPLAGMFQSGSQLVADRYSYLAALPWALLAGAGLVAALRAASSTRRAAARAVAALLIAALSAACVAQQTYWRDSEVLWGRALALDPDSGTALLGLGHALAARGDVARAEKLFVRAEATDSACASDLARLLALTRAGRGAEAEALRLRDALDPRPTCRHAAEDLAAARAALGEYAAAREGFAAALAADPRDAAARANMDRLDGLERTAPRPRF
ncbi:MAG: hypothetical protein HKL90_16010 [Elusimicrobia bacterium]|nr:hypothetical protein [Elusimicrobiota bacterium]